MSEKQRLVFPENGGRNAEYQQKLQKIDEAGICPFCQEHLEAWVGKEFIVSKHKHWIITQTNPPYKGSIAHLLVIARTHVTDATQLSAEARIEHFDIIDWIVSKYQLKHYTSVMRSGHPESGATVAHLHFHLASAGEENILTRIG